GGEGLSPPRQDEFRGPALAVGLYDWGRAFAHHAGRAGLLATGLPERLEAGPQRAAGRLRWAREVLKRPPPPARPPRLPGIAASELCPQYELAGLPGGTSNLDRAGYLPPRGRAP